MMKYKIIGLILCSVFIFSCKEKEIKKEEEEGNGELPEWIKGNTANVYFLSTLSDKNIDANEETFNEISLKLKNKESHLIMLDRSDIQTEFGKFNGSVYLSSKLKKFHAFGLNKIDYQSIQGTGILLNEPISKQNQRKIADDCFIKLVNTFMKKTQFPVATVRFQNENHINSSKDILKPIEGESRVIIGSIQKDLKDKLGKIIKENDKRYHVDFVLESGDYVLFVAAPKFWVLRETNKFDVKEDLKMFELKIEANVFY